MRQETETKKSRNCLRDIDLPYSMRIFLTDCERSGLLAKSAQGCWRKNKFAQGCWRRSGKETLQVSEEKVCFILQ